jgi:hypothetical protein
MNRDTDRLDWLREIRQEIVRRCGSDPKAMGDYFRNCQKQYQDRIITNPSERIIQRASA